MPRGGRLNKRDVLLFCSACHHNTAFDDPEDLVECHCCHRIFHTTCYSRHVARTEGLSLPDPDEWDAGVPWFHSQACHQVAEGLQRAVAAGEQAVVASGRHGNGHSWRLPTWLGGGGALPTAASATTGAAAADDRPPPRHTWRLLACASPRASPSSRLAMNQVYDVLSRDFGYTLGDYAQFDVAALLRTDGRPVCAAILDVYGADVAELFVVATRQELRRQGHCRMLMDQMAACLASAGVKKLVVSIDDDDSEAAEVWARLGFVPLAETKMRQLSWSLPAFSSQATEGTKYLCQELRA